MGWGQGDSDRPETGGRSALGPKQGPGLALSRSRRLLRSLRDVMAAGGRADDRLQQIARLVAADLVAEVCSIYIRRAGDVLELFATEGLNPEAVHQTRLRIGEGLVGEVAANARPVAYSDAQSQPGFAYRPETGEEAFNAFVGVPVMSAGRVVGVLVGQNRAQRHYDEEEIESLQTVAMVLAELISGGEIVDPEEFLPADGNAVLPLRLTGLSFHGGLAMGRAVLHRPRIVVDHVVADDPDAEFEKLSKCVEQMRASLDDMFADSGIDNDGEHAEVIETYKMFASDKGWVKRIEDAIGTGLTADAAVLRVLDDMRARLGSSPDPYLRERITDLEDLSYRLIEHMTGKPQHAKDLPKNAIIVASDLGPAELLEYDRSKLRGVAVAGGSPTAHMAIIARALDIPVIGRIPDLLENVEDGDRLLLDGENEQLFVRPGEEVRGAFKASMKLLNRKRAAFARLRDLPAETRDGVRISLSLNAGLLIDMQHLDEAGADGVGLYRTEIPFMARSAFPGVEEQIDIYSRVLDQAGGRPVVFRTLDVGGDKVLPYLEAENDENPAMGWRAIRIGLDRPAMLRQQLRALVRSAKGRTLSIMFPMISEVAELDAARRLLDTELAREARRNGKSPVDLRIGAMLEVPALVWQLETLLPRIDFLSIGSNDLVQFMFASDRSNPRVAARYDTLSPAVLNLFSAVVDGCERHNVDLTLCGEMAGRPIEAMALLGLGFRSLSMAPPAIGPVKSMIRSLDLAALTEYVGSLRNLPDHSVRAKLRAFAVDHGVSL